MPRINYSEGRVYHFDNTYDEPVPIFGDFQLHQIGETCLEAGCDWMPHEQYCYEISYIVSGEGTFGTNDRLFHVRPNDVYLSGCHEMHTILADRDSRLRYMYLGFMPRDSEHAEPRLREALDYFDSVSTPCQQDSCGVGDLMRRLTQEFYCRQPCFEEIVASSLKLLVYSAYRNSMAESAVARIDSGSSGNFSLAIYSISRYINDHAMDIQDIREIADKLGYSYSYISHVFRSKTGETLQSYLRRKKMEKAVELMQYADLSISQAAERLKYQNVQSFSKAFRSVYGLSPTEYMNQLHPDRK